MGKYNLGKAKVEIQNQITKDRLYVNEAKANSIVKDIDSKLDNVATSFNKINNILNRTVTMGMIKGTRGNSFKSWAKKSKSQASNALKLKEKMNEKYSDDVKDYPISLLNERIEELERKIASMSE